MITKLIDWLKRMWRDDVPEAIEQTWFDEYEPYVRNKYGIPKAFIDEEKEDKHWNT